MEESQETNQNNTPEETLPQKEYCDFCKNITQNPDVLSCNHKICPICLYRRFFIQDIPELEGLCDSIVIKCTKCTTGFITKSLDDLIEIFNKKNNLIKELKEKQTYGVIEKCQFHQLLKEYYCLDCCEHLCKRCKSSDNKDHQNHNIMTNDKVVKSLKAEINNIPLKCKQKIIFEQTLGNISKNFKDASMENYNETLEQIKELSKSIEEFKKEYEEKYKLELTKVIKTLKILKLCYNDYYSEKDEALEGKDIETLRYINSIKNELLNMEMSKDITFSQKLNDAKNIVDNLRNSANKFNFNLNIKYQKLKPNFNFEYELKSVHEKYITSLLLLNDDKILTTSRDYKMKIWDEKENEYSLDKTIEKRCGCVICAIPVENNKILTSSLTNNNIYMWGENPTEGLSIEQSLSLHSDIVLSMIKLENGNLVSSGKDNNIIIWKKNEGGFYEEKQIIKEEKTMFKLISLKNNKFGYTSDDGLLHILEESAEDQKYKKICELNHEGIILSMCELNNGYIFTGGTGFKEKKNNHIYIWKPDREKGYIFSQKLSGHKSDVNDIKQLKDGRIISSSRDRNLIIWKDNIVVNNNTENNNENNTNTGNNNNNNENNINTGNNNNNNNNNNTENNNNNENNNNKEKKENEIKYMKNEVLSEYPHGMFLLTQLRDGRICTSTSNNSLIFWRKWGSLPYC